MQMSKAIDGKSYDSEVIEYLLDRYFTEIDEATLVYDSYICLFKKHPSIEEVTFLANHYYGYFMGLGDLISYIKEENILDSQSFCIVCPDSEYPLAKGSLEGYFKIVEGRANALFWF